MAQSFIGSLISLTSTSDIRYRGVLQSIDHANSTIQLADVYSMGTENRRPANEFLPANPKPYDYIVFRATEVKDLVVERRAEDLQTQQNTNVLADPAVIGASQPNATTAGGSGGGQPGGTNTDRVRSAEAAVESVERAMDQLRVTPNPQQQQSRRGGGGGGGGGGRRGGGGVKGPGVVPEAPFDFQRANARFDKTSIGTDVSLPDSGAVTPTSQSSPTPPAGSAGYYDKKKSFFDDISSDAKSRMEGGGGIGREVARQRRDEERNRNLSTFGETGMTGLREGGGRGGSGGGRRGRGGRRRGGGGERGGGRGGHGGGGGSSAAAVASS